MPDSMPSIKKNDVEIVQFGPYDVPHAEVACLLGPQRDAIMFSTNVNCHLRDRRKGNKDVRMMLTLKGPSDANFVQAREQANAYVNSNFNRNIRTHNDAREQGLLPPKEEPSSCQGSRQTREQTRDKKADNAELLREAVNLAKQEMQEEQMQQQMAVHEQQMAQHQMQQAMYAQQHYAQQMQWACFAQQPMPSAAQQQMAYRAASWAPHATGAVDDPRSAMRAPRKKMGTRRKLR